MARAAKASKSTKSPTAARKPGRSSAAAADKTVKVTKSTAVDRKVVAPTAKKRTSSRPATAAVVSSPKASRTTKTAMPLAAPAPKVSKEELRAQVAKLEGLVATLRAKSRETNKAAKAATTRIAELEAQVAQLEKKVAAAPALVRQSKARNTVRAGRQDREIDPGDAVPSGVAVQEPAPLDAEAETALENLNEHLGHE